MGQIANMLNLRPPDALPNDTKRSLREHITIIALRSGEELK